jgi:integrase
MSAGVYVDQLASGKWRARYRDADGRMHSKAFDRRADAIRWGNGQKTSVHNGSHIDPSDRTTVLDYAERWTAGREYKELSVRQGRTYLNHLRGTPLGDMGLRNAAPSDVQSWINSRSRLLAPQTVRNLYTWLKAVFRSATEDRLITHTPCTSRLSLPKIPKPRIEPLTVQQVHLIADGMPPRYRMAVLLQASCGLRISELLALQVRDVDFMRRTVSVDRQLARDGHRFVSPKTESSRRTVPLMSDVALLLSEHVAKFPPNSEGVLFTTTEGNPIRQDYYSTKLFRPAVKSAGLPNSVSSHDLRHHFASILIRQGLPVNIVSHYLGHSTATLVLETYSHLMPDSEDLAREKLESAWHVSQAVSQDRAATL